MLLGSDTLFGGTKTGPIPFSITQAEKDTPCNGYQISPLHGVSKKTSVLISAKTYPTDTYYSCKIYFTPSVAGGLTIKGVAPYATNGWNAGTACGGYQHFNQEDAATIEKTVSLAAGVGFYLRFYDWYHGGNLTVTLQLDFIA